MHNTTTANRRPFTAVIITHNVARTIRPCLEALVQVCDEILVLDTESTDGTQAICQSLGVVPVQHEWLGFSKTKNAGNLLAKNDWILSIDADEVLSPELIACLQNLVVEQGRVYSLDRLTDYCGRWIHHSGWYPDWKVRLFDRRAVAWQGDYVHETLAIPEGYQELRLSGKLYHYSYLDSDDHLQRMEKYARLSAQEQFRQGKRATFSKRWLSPFARFVRTFFIKKGFLDGRAGWTISLRNAAMVRRRYQLLRALHEGKTI